MTALNRKAFGGLLWLLVVLATSLFVPAWTLNYWQAWVFLTVFSASVLAITVYLMRKDPHLLERRVRGGPFAEKELSQQVTQFVASIAFVAVFVLSALDHRFGWSLVAPGVALAGDVLVAVGLLIVFLVFKLNGKIVIERDELQTRMDALAALVGKASNGDGRAAPGKTPGRGGARSAKAKVHPLKGKKALPKYRGPNGETWAGRGLTPRWMTALEKKGKKRESFLIKP